MTCWVHVSQIPDPVREALDACDAPQRQEDERLEVALLRAARAERLRARVPALVRAAMGTGISVRQAIQAVALHSGLSEAYVKALYYAKGTV